MGRKKVSIVIVLFIVCIGGLAVVIINDYRSFTPEKWREEPDKRYVLVKNMVKKYDFGNMTREQVISLLGEPEKDRKAVGFALRDDGTGPVVQLSSPNSMVYYTKTGRTPEEYRGFYLLFDNNGKVVDWAIIRFTT